MRHRFRSDSLIYTAGQRQNTVAAYYKREQLLHFAFAKQLTVDQHCANIVIIMRICESAPQIVLI